MSVSAKISDRADWFDIWFEDKKDMVNLFAHNMAADLEAGYDYFGSSIQKQIREINEYQAEFDKQMDEFKTMDEKAANRWCFYDLKKRGAIE